jgi:hypothetical protein
MSARKAGHSTLAPGASPASEETLLTPGSSPQPAIERGLKGFTLHLTHLHTAPSPSKPRLLRHLKHPIQLVVHWEDGNLGLTLY